jgi:F-type H+-transporting ATPase subunit epsilon
MAASFRLSILTPEKTVIDDDVAYVQAPGKAGYLGILAHHAPLVTALEPGLLTARGLEGEENRYCISGGFLEVSRNQVVILADAMERCDAVDVERARAAEKRARERLQRAKSDASIDMARATAALRRALNRIKLAARSAS